MKLIINFFIFSVTLLGCKSNVNPKSTNSTLIANKNINTALGSHKNIKIYQQSSKNSLGPCEPSIAINPNNTNQIIAGSVIDFVHKSNDGGKTWQTEKLKSDLGVWGDPVLLADEQGDFYYFHLSDPDKTNWQSERILDRIVCQKSSDQGATWSNGSSIGLNVPKQQDKPLAGLNPKTGDIYVTWTEFDKYDSPLPMHKSRILFSKSVNNGTTWSTPIQLNELEGDCLDDDFTTEGVMPVSDGEHIYTTWCFDKKIFFTKSTDNGESWKKPKVIFKQNAGWSLNIPGVNRANGFPVLAIDNSKNKGNLYLNWADQDENGITQIFVSQSKNGGTTWSDPLKIQTNSRNAHQFFNWMSIDQSTGNIYIVYYETNHIDANLIDVKLAISNNDGKSFNTHIISESPFNPVGANFFGDYNYIDAKNGVVRPIWTRVNNGLLSVWTALINL